VCTQTPHTLVGIHQISGSGPCEPETRYLNIWLIVAHRSDHKLKLSECSSLKPFLSRTVNCADENNRFAPKLFLAVSCTIKRAALVIVLDYLKIVPNYLVAVGWIAVVLHNTISDSARIIKNHIWYV